MESCFSVFFVLVLSACKVSAQTTSPPLLHKTNQTTEGAIDVTSPLVDVPANWTSSAPESENNTAAVLAGYLSTSTAQTNAATSSQVTHSPPLLQETDRTVKDTVAVTSPLVDVPTNLTSSALEADNMTATASTGYVSTNTPTTDAAASSQVTSLILDTTSSVPTDSRNYTAESTTPLVAQDNDASTQSTSIDANTPPYVVAYTVFTSSANEDPTAATLAMNTNTSSTTSSGTSADEPTAPPLARDTTQPTTLVVITPDFESARSSSTATASSSAPDTVARAAAEENTLAELTEPAATQSGASATTGAFSETSVLSTAASAVSGSAELTRNDVFTKSLVSPTTTHQTPSESLSFAATVPLAPTSPSSGSGTREVTRSNDTGTTVARPADSASSRTPPSANVENDATDSPSGNNFSSSSLASTTSSASSSSSLLIFAATVPTNFNGSLPTDPEEDNLVMSISNGKNTDKPAFPQDSLSGTSTSESARASPETTTAVTIDSASPDSTSVTTNSSVSLLTDHTLTYEPTRRTSAVYHSTEMTTAPYSTTVTSGGEVSFSMTASPATGRVQTTTSPATGSVPTTTSPATGSVTTTTSPATGSVTTTTSPATGSVTTTASPATGSVTTTTSPATGSVTTTASPATGSVPTTTSPATGSVPTTASRNASLSEFTEALSTLFTDLQTILTSVGINIATTPATFTPASTTPSAPEVSTERAPFDLPSTAQAPDEPAINRGADTTAAATPLDVTTTTTFALWPIGEPAHSTTTLESSSASPENTSAAVTDEGETFTASTLDTQAAIEGETTLPATVTSSVNVSSQPPDFNTTADNKMPDVFPDSAGSNATAGEAQSSGDSEIAVTSSTTPTEPTTLGNMTSEVTSASVPTDGDASDDESTTKATTTTTTTSTSSSRPGGGRNILLLVLRNPYLNFLDHGDFIPPVVRIDALLSRFAGDRHVPPGLRRLVAVLRGDPWPPVPQSRATSTTTTTTSTPVPATTDWQGESPMDNRFSTGQWNQGQEPPSPSWNNSPSSSVAQGELLLPRAITPAVARSPFDIAREIFFRRRYGNQNPWFPLNHVLQQYLRGMISGHLPRQNWK